MKLIELLLQIKESLKEGGLVHLEVCSVGMGSRLAATLAIVLNDDPAMEAADLNQVTCPEKGFGDLIRHLRIYHNFTLSAALKNKKVAVVWRLHQREYASGESQRYVSPIMMTTPNIVLFQHRNGEVEVLKNHNA